MIDASTKREVAAHIQRSKSSVTRAEAFEFVEGELTILLLAPALTKADGVSRDALINVFLRLIVLGIEEQFPALEQFDVVLLDEQWMAAIEVDPCPE